MGRRTKQSGPARKARALIGPRQSGFQPELPGIHERPVHRDLRLPEGIAGSGVGEPVADRDDGGGDEGGPTEAMRPRGKEGSC
jgi:hypothetical protein